MTKRTPANRGKEGDPCPDCGEQLRSEGYCWSCEHDRDEERREFHAWNEYVRDYRDKLGAIAEAAERVCDEREQEVLGAQFLGWSDERTAGHLGLSEKSLLAFREEIYEKVRAAIGQERMAELMRRRR